jgi:hypothetical protein
VQHRFLSDFISLRYERLHSSYKNLYTIFIPGLCNYRFTEFHFASERGWGRGPLPSLNDDGPNPYGFGPSLFSADYECFINGLNSTQTI